MLQVTLLRYSNLQTILLYPGAAAPEGRRAATGLALEHPTEMMAVGKADRFRHLLAELAGERLVILSTHIESDIEASAGMLAIMSGGRLRFHGTPETLMAQAEGHVWQWTLPAEQLAEARARLRISRAQRRAHGVEVRVVGDESPAADAISVAPDLEDAYLFFIGGKK